MEFDFTCANCRCEIPLGNLDEHFIRCFQPIEIDEDRKPIRKREVIIIDDSDDEPITEQQKDKNSQGGGAAAVKEKKKKDQEVHDCPICYE